mmetsp:Transcript_12131/g.24647  ORF Transcript_12131/g.24647 Transcript_12131/m.24647 type:complete len:80 (-) Transcript_12131:643-882(-)
MNSLGSPLVKLSPSSSSNLDSLGRMCISPSSVTPVPQAANLSTSVQAVSTSMSLSSILPASESRQEALLQNEGGREEKA